MYDAWVPKPFTSKPSVPVIDGTLVTDTDNATNLRMLDETSPDAARIYYSIAPQYAIQQQENLTSSINVIQCLLYNASWTVDFSTHSTGTQSLTPYLEFQNWIPGWQTLPSMRTPTQLTNETTDYTALMEIFGSITAGHMVISTDPTIPFEQTSTMLQTSPLMFSKAVFPDTISASDISTLQTGLEQVFQNMTLSARYAVLPHQDLRGDTALLTHVSTNATSTFFRSQYVYTARDLILTYCLAIAASGSCIVLALFTVAENGNMYTNSFSAIVRVTRDQHCLDEVIETERDKSGAEPLPRKISRAYISLGRPARRKDKEGGVTEWERVWI